MKIRYTEDEETAHVEPIRPKKKRDEPEIVTVRGLKLARNPNFVYADLDGVRIAVMAGRKHASRLVGKPITVRVDTTGPETTYQYQP